MNKFHGIGQLHKTAKYREMSDGQYVLSIPLHTSYTIVHKVLLQLLFVLENIGYYIITEKNTDRGFEIYSLMSATIQFSQNHLIFEMMYSLKLCNQNLTIYCCIFFLLQIPWEAHRKIKDMYSQSWLDFGWAFKIFFI